MDRNGLELQLPAVDDVALLAEGVDRNIFLDQEAYGDRRSPSSRRAWIEIQLPRRPGGTGTVALLAEGMDRNRQVSQLLKDGKSCPPHGGRR